MKIRYDKKSIRILIIAFVISVVFAIAANILLEAADMTIMIFGMIMFVPLSFALFVCLIDGIVYLARLKAYGYEIPEDRKKYQNYILNVPFDEHKREKRLQQEEVRHVPSIIMGILYIVVALLIFGRSVGITVDWIHLMDDILFYCLVAGIVILVVALRGIHFFKQSDGRKYSERIIPDDGKKKRSSVVGGMFVLFIALVVSYVNTSLNESMLRYTLHARLSNDCDVMYRISMALRDSYDELQDEQQKSQVMERIKEGFVMSELDTLPEEYVWKVQEHLAAMSADTYEEQIKLSKHPLVIRVWYDEDSLYVTNENHVDISCIKDCGEYFDAKARWIPEEE